MKKIKEYIIFLFTGWRTINCIPPNMEVQVKDEYGNIALGVPTYYPFEVKHFKGDENKPYGWQGTPVFHGNGIEKWDGNWAIFGENLTNPIKGKIIKWKKI